MIGYFYAYLGPLKSIYKILTRSILILLLLIITLYGLIHLPPVQTFLVQQATLRLSKSLHTKVQIDHVDISFFNKLAIKGIYIEDLHKDTLLYAGALSVKINDWFFVKDTVTLHYIGLDNAVIKLNRKDSTWNYQFLVDYFNQPSGNTQKGNNIQLDIKELSLQNISLKHQDDWIGESNLVQLDACNVSIRQTDIANQKIEINRIDLQHPVFERSDYTGNRPPSLHHTPVVVTKASPKQKDNWTVLLDQLTIQNGVFADEIETERAPYADHFDGQHMRFSSIEASIQKLSLKNNQLTANLNLSTKERSGLMVKKLSSELTFNDSIMEFNNLDLHTNRSRLKNYYAMRFKSFNYDMNRFMSNVVLEGRFDNSTLSSEDIAIFAPELKDLNRTASIEGTIKGTLEDLKAKNLLVQTNSSVIKGDLHLKGLSDISTTFIDFNSEGSRTKYDDLSAIVPSLKKITQPNISKLGNIYFKGRFTGLVNDFIAKGDFVTDLGKIHADLSMKLPSEAPALYNGSVLISDFNLGNFVDNRQFGKISLNGKIEGKGFSLAELDANFTGEISQFEYNGYKYQNILASGNFLNSSFKGKASIDDPNLVIKNLVGSLNLSKKDISFNLTADLQHSNFKNIRFSENDLSLTGLIGLHFTGNTIDNFLGEAKIYNARLYNRNDRLSFDSLKLYSSIVDGQKQLSLETNELDVAVKGKFKILELPAAFTTLLNRYYPAYIKAPSGRIENQEFTFNIQTKNIQEYLKLIDTKLSGLNDASINGNIAASKNEINLTGSIPEVYYDNKVFRDILLQSNGNKDSLKTVVRVGDISLSDSMHFPDTKLTIYSSNNQSDIHLKTSGVNTLNEADLNANVEVLTDGVKIHFYPSSFMINDRKWALEKDGELTLRNNYIEANQINFSHNQQQISIYSELDKTDNQPSIVAKLREVQLDDFIPFILKEPQVKGILTGEAIIKNPLDKISVKFSGKADSLSLDNKYVGNVSLSTNADTHTGEISYHVATTDTTNIFEIDGDFNLQDSSAKQLTANLKAEKIHLSILEPYLGDVFSSMEGTASSQLTLSGDKSHPLLIGEVLIKNSALKVAYTQCRYFVENQKVIFRNDEIDLGFMKLKDSLYNTATLSGKIHHEFFNHLSFENINLETAKLSLLNTTQKDNEAFYGNIIGRAKMNINGPLSNIQMNIDGEPSILDSSHIYLPTSEGKESNKIDYIDFIRFGTQSEERSFNQGTNIVVNLHIKANPSCKVDVILDEETGDIIKGQGNGMINIRVGNIEPLTIRGNFSITKGEYNFNFQTFLQKPFTLNKGTITWNGDPYQASIDIDAEYLAKNVDISNLTTSGGFQQKEDVKIISHLTGVLQNPQVTFDFELPEKSDAKRNDIIVKRLAEFKNDENEMNKQVASLLLFNTFIIGNQNFLSQGNASTLITNTIGGMVSNLLTNFFNRELEKATKGILTTYIDINPTLDLQKSTAQLQANVRAGLKILFSNRLVLLVGGNLDYNNPSYSQQLEKKGLLTPDLNIQWLINKDGSLRVVGFNRSSIDFTMNQRNRSGLQLSYRKDINKLSDIFKSRKKLQAAENNFSQPADKPKEN